MRHRFYSNDCIRKAMDMARQLTVLADEGEAAARDDGCAVLCGVLRDCAYKIRGRAELERATHRQQGTWEEHTGAGEG